MLRLPPPAASTFPRSRFLSAKQLLISCLGLLLAASAGSLLSGCGSQNAETNVVDPPTARGGPLLLTGVTVVDTHDGHLTPNTSVLLRGGKIIIRQPFGSPRWGLGRLPKPGTTDGAPRWGYKPAVCVSPNKKGPLKQVFAASNKDFSMGRFL